MSNMTTVPSDKLLAMQKQFKALEQQNSELVVYCNDLRNELKKPYEYQEATAILRKIPKQSLVNIQAYVIEEMMDELSGNINYDSVSDYANKLREQAND